MIMKNIYVFVLTSVIYAKITIELEPSFQYFQPFLDPKQLRLIDTDKSRYMTNNNSATLENISNVTSIQMQYRGVIYLGSPPQAFDIIFDTGSSVTYIQWLWVPSTTCGCHSAKHRFNQTISTSFLGTSTFYELKYGRGYAEGYLAEDTISLGSKSLIQVMHQKFIVVDRDSDFEGLAADGILVTAIKGLGFVRISDGYDTLILNLKKQKLIEHAKFAIYLSDNDFGADLQDKPASNIIIGDSDFAAFSVPGTAQSLKVFSETGYWSLSLQSVSVNGEDIKIKSIIAIVDTGTSLILAPASNLYSAEVFNIIHQVALNKDCYESNGFLVCDCGVNYSIEDYPTIEIVLDGKTFNLPPQFYFWKYENYCQLLVLSFGNGNFWVLGDVFLRRYYAEFDMDASVLTFAESINSVSVVEKVSWYLYAVVVVMAMIAVGMISVFLVWLFKHEGVSPGDSPMSRIQYVNNLSR